MLTSGELVGSRYLLEDGAEMNDYDASTYGDGVADVYDGWHSGADVAPIVDRLAALDLMARLAGLQLRDRWGGWNEESFTASSGNHVTVYERPG